MTIFTNPYCRVRLPRWRVRRIGRDSMTELPKNLTNNKGHNAGRQNHGEVAFSAAKSEDGGSDISTVQQAPFLNRDEYWRCSKSGAQLSRCTPPTVTNTYNNNERSTPRRAWILGNDGKRRCLPLGHQMLSVLVANSRVRTHKEVKRLVEDSAVEINYSRKRYEVKVTQKAKKRSAQRDKSSYSSFTAKWQIIGALSHLQFSLAVDPCYKCKAIRQKYLRICVVYWWL